MSMTSPFIVIIDLQLSISTTTIIQTRCGMTRHTLFIFAGIGISLAAGLFAQASVIDFELPVGALDTIPRPYFGLVFSASPYNGIAKSSDSDLPGVVNGLVSGTNVLVTDPQEFSITPLHPELGEVFDFISGYFTAAKQISLPVIATAVQNGATLTRSFTLDTSGPTFVRFDWIGISEIGFVGSAIGNYNDTRIVMDDLTVSSVPELDTFWLIAISAAIAGVYVINWQMRRRKTKHLLFAAAQC